MPRPVFLGLFLGRKPSPHFNTYLVLFPRWGMIGNPAKATGLADPGWVTIGLWRSRRSFMMGERIWLRGA